MAASMQQTLRTCVIAQTLPKPNAAVIFLHGSGDTGQGAREWIRFLLGQEFAFPHIRILFPTAPERPYTVNQGNLSTVWFDRLKISQHVPEDAETTNSSCRLMEDLIQKQVADGIPLERILVGGFSMGGCLALHVGYRFQRRLAGVFALSSFLNNESIVYKAVSAIKGESLPPLFMCHGEQDPLVLFDWGKSTFSSLKSLGVNGQFHTFPNMLHEMKKKELKMLKSWIEEHVPLN